MKTFVFFLVILSSAAFSSASFNLLKPKAKIFSVLNPATRYRRVNYVSAPVVLSKPVAVASVYVQPAPVVTSHVSTYSTAVPATYTAPVTTYALPVSSYQVPLTTTYRVPATTYGVTFPAYHSPAITYGAPSLGYSGAVHTFNEPICDDVWQYSAYAKSYKY